MIDYEIVDSKLEEVLDVKFDANLDAKFVYNNV